MLFRKIVLTTLVATTLPFTAQAQTRTKRRAPARPAAKPAAGRPAATATRAAAPTAQGGISLTARDMALLVEGLGLPPEVRARLSGDAEERKAFAGDLRHMLAAAEEAKAAGYLARPDLKLQSELARAFVIAQAFFKQQQDAGASSPEQVVTEAEIDAFFKEAATAAQFEAFVQDYANNGPERGATVTDERRRELREHYGRVMLAMRKGVAAGLDRERKTQLVIMLQQARLLEGAYAKELKSRLKATDAEVDAYIAAHPELDTKAQRAKIEGVLARIRAGEDFAKLANEVTEDPSGKGTGGDLGWFGRGVMVKPFEDAAFALKPGEVSGIFETVFGYHIVKLDERRTQGAGEEVHARHILIQYPKASRRPNSPPMPPREQARAAVEEEKLTRLLDEAAARRHIQVAEEYSDGDASTGTPPTAPATTKPTANLKSAAPRPAPTRKMPARRRP
ncbi:MAG: peptidylprolyl isomerase [Pyrinomonadaceae bacterium]